MFGKNGSKKHQGDSVSIRVKLSHRSRFGMMANGINQDNHRLEWDHLSQCATSLLPSLVFRESPELLFRRVREGS